MGIRTPDLLHAMKPAPSPPPALTRRDQPNSDPEQRRATPSNARRRPSATQTATQDTPAQHSPAPTTPSPGSPCNASVTGLIKHGPTVTKTASTPGISCPQSAYQARSDRGNRYPEPRGTAVAP